MYKNNKILGLIPARAESIRVKDKNLKKIAGKPLIYWTINEAKQVKFIDKIIVSTDSQRIAQYSEKLGIKVPGLRPKTISKDESKMIEVINHTLMEEKKIGNIYDYIIVLQPTSPLRKKIDICNAIKMLKNKDKKNIISICPVDHPSGWTGKLNKSGSMKNFISSNNFLKRSQDFVPEYRINGAIYLYNIKILNKNQNIFKSKYTYPIIMSRECSIDIDDITDFKIAELLLKHRRHNS